MASPSGKCLIYKCKSDSTIVRLLGRKILTDFALVTMKISVKKMFHMLFVEVFFFYLLLYQMI